jgi:hypothetical protein
VVALPALNDSEASDPLQGSTGLRSLENAGASVVNVE